MSLKTVSPGAWALASFVCVALLVSNGMTISGLSVYDVVFMDTFGWSLGEIKFRDMITLALTGLLAPVAGIALDRFGVRRCMLVGWLVLAAAYVSYSQLQNLAQMYWLHAAFAIVLVFCGLNAAVILVSNWFVRYRGTAIGIALSGTSLGGALLPQYGTAMLERFGWQTAFLVAAGLPVLLWLVTLVFVRDRPGGGDAQASDATEAADEGVRFAEALRSRTFWALAFIAMTTFYTVLGVQAHIYKYMRDAGFDAQLATNAISLFFIAALVGKFAFGLVADLLDQRRVFYGNLAVMLMGSLILLAMNPQTAWLAVLTFGLGWGGVYTLLQLTVMNSFGLRDAGKILGTITILDAGGGGLGIWLTGVLYDRTGSYELPFTIFAVLVAVALVCLTMVRPVARDA